MAAAITRELAVALASVSILFAAPGCGGGAGGGGTSGKIGRPATPIAAGRRPGAIRNLTGQDAAVGGAVDLMLVPQPPPPSGPPEVVSARFVDKNGDGKCNDGDVIEVRFNKPVVVGTGASMP